jgi:DNA-directed RNA polymerase subunit RPC12/RpoP
MADEKTVHCPECGSEDIREKNTAYAELPVTEWETSGTVPQPTNYDTDASPDWEVSDEAFQYICANCRVSFELDRLIVKDAPSSGQERADG